MPPPTCCTCTRCGRDSTRCWRARGAPSWRAAASISCRHALCLTWKAGPSRTFSRISAWGWPGGARPRPEPSESAIGGEVFGGKTRRAPIRSTAADERLLDRSSVRREADAMRRRRATRDLAGRADAGASAAEIAGLERLARTLDGAFGRALDLCAAARGRLIVTGIGKSGHVARKIAATLASTGTPAQFVHAGGGQPRRSRHDRRRGRDPRLVEFRRERRTGRHHRLFAPLRDPADRDHRRPRTRPWPQAADVVLLLPGAAEACPMGLAPTTSTTMMMALGDALAIALLERKGFSSADFQLFHPGGRLGRRPVAGRRHHAFGRRGAAGVAADADVGSDPRDDREELRLRRRVRRRGAAGRGHHRRRSAPPHGRPAARAHGRGDHAPRPEDDHAPRISPPRRWG